MGATRRYHHEGIRRGYARPCRGNASQPTCLIVEIDAVLRPCAAPIDQNELSSIERMERMSYAEARYLINRIECS
jgi:hypothetical protein